MRIPASLLSIHALIVKVREETFAIPSASVKTAASRGLGEFSKHDGELIYTYQGERYPAREFASLVNYADESDLAKLNQCSVVIVDAESGAYALAVNAIVSAKEFLARSLGNYVRSVRGVSAVSLLPNGAVIPIIDVTSLIAAPADQRFSNYVAAQRSAAREAGASVLVVDDSLSVRRTLAELLGDAGYRVIQAADGLEAANIIAERVPNIVLTDMEMPRMNGLELATHIRVQPALANLPVIMITSRSTQKHRDQAKAAGVSRYVTKPYSDVGLLRDVAELLAT
jgi:CheY-like chemotaxis protein